MSAAVAALLVPAGTASAQSADPRGGLDAGTEELGGAAATSITPKRDAETGAQGLDLLASRDKPAYTGVAPAFNYSNINSDIAFQGRYAFSGNYRGFGVYDISDPAAPTLRTTVNCVGGQGDVSVLGSLLFMSTESTTARVDCSTNASSAVFRGVRIFDISNPLEPRYITGVQTCRGSHTHTVVEDPDDPANVYVYVSGTAGVRPATQLAGCANPSTGNTAASQLGPDGKPLATSRFQVEVIKVPRAAPATAAVVTRARLMADPVTGSPAGLWPGGDHGPGTQTTSASDACHDITAYPAIGLAAGACEGNGILIDISDPANPVRIDEVARPELRLLALRDVQRRRHEGRLHRRVGRRQRRALHPDLHGRRRDAADADQLGRQRHLRRGRHAAGEVARVPELLQDPERAAGQRGLRRPQRQPRPGAGP